MSVQRPRHDHAGTVEDDLRLPRLCGYRFAVYFPSVIALKIYVNFLEACLHRVRNGLIAFLVQGWKHQVKGECVGALVFFIARAYLCFPVVLLGHQGDRLCIRVEEVEMHGTCGDDLSAVAYLLFQRFWLGLDLKHKPAIRSQLMTLAASL